MKCSAVRETVASGVPGFVGDLRDALGALRRYDDGRNSPIPAYWEQETRRFGVSAFRRDRSAEADERPANPCLLQGPGIT